MIPQYTIRDHTFPNIQDESARSYIGYGQAVVGIGADIEAPCRGRIKGATLAGSDGTTTVTIKVNGITVSVLDTEALTVENDLHITYNRGDIIEAELTGGTTQGTVSLNTEEHELIKRDDLRAATASERFTRATQKASYDPQPEKKKNLRERYGSFAEATARIQEANQAVVYGSPAPERDRGPASTSQGGTGNAAGPSSGARGKPSKGFK